MIARLKSVEGITVITEHIGGPTCDYNIEAARRFANGHLPTGVEEFYRQVSSFCLEWTYTSLLNKRRPMGCIDIQPILRTFGDNWRDKTWFPLPDGVQPTPEDKWQFKFQNVLPFDIFQPEACGCFLMDPIGGESVPENFIAYHYFGEELVRSQYTFTEYIERMLKTYGFWYWTSVLASSVAVETGESEEFGQFMTKVYGSSWDDYFNRPGTELD